MSEELNVLALPRRFHDPLCERFSGETVLEDYARLAEIPAPEARLIMIRFLAAQYFVNRLRGDWVVSLLRLERSAALNVIGTGLVLDRELRLLRRALELDDPENCWSGTVLSLLAAIAERAQERGHVGGATAFNRIAYEAAVNERLWLVAAGAAERLSYLTAATDLPGRRRWRRRARVLARRGASAPEPSSVALAWVAPADCQPPAEPVESCCPPAEPGGSYCPVAEAAAEYCPEAEPLGCA